MMKMTGISVALLTAVAAAAMMGSTPAQAESGKWMFRVGAHNVDPKSDNGSLAGGALDVSVDSAIGPTFNIDYFVTPNIAIDVLAALPFEHDINLNGAKAGSTKHLPPTVSVQFHFNPEGSIDPYAAVGINYTAFWEDKLDNSAASFELDDSWGLAAQAGVDFALTSNHKWVLGVDVRYISIETDAKVGGADVGTVEIDPLAYGLNIGYRY